MWEVWGLVGCPRMVSMNKENVSLVLVGHGSHFNPDSSRPVYEHADRLSRSAQFGEIHVGFWKEEPSLSRCLDAVSTPWVVIVPLFMSSGYFTEQVIPREMRLRGRVTEHCL